MVYRGELTHVSQLNTNEQLYQLFDKMATESLQLLSTEGALSAAAGSDEWRKKLLADLQYRLETKVPAL